MADMIDELAYRFWSIHPKDIPEPVGMPECYKGGARAWFYANEMRRISALPAQGVDAADAIKMGFWSAAPGEWRVGDIERVTNAILAALAPAEAGGVGAAKCRHCDGAGYHHGMRCNCKDTRASVDALVKAALLEGVRIATSVPIEQVPAAIDAALSAYRGGAK